MAYWGEAMCHNQALWYNESVEKARAVLAKLAPARAARQAKAPTGREKGYLDAVERLFGDGDKAQRNRAYADRMAELTRQFPDDDEAAALYALSLLGTIPSGQRDPVTSLKAGNIASAILKKNQEHPGAAHYALHAFDDGEHAAMGLQAARTTRASRRLRATRVTCRRTCSCRSGCGTRRWRRTKRRSRPRWSG